MEEIQTGSFGSRNPLKGNYAKIAMLALAVVIVVAAVVTGAYYIHNRRQATPKVQYNFPASTTPEQKALYLANNNQYQAATQVYKQELSSTNNKSTKINIYGMLAYLAIRFKDYASAQQYADEAKSLDPQSSGPYVYLAQLNTAEGNKTIAKQYWQQAINYLSSNQAGYNMIKADYQRNITALQ